MIGTLGNTTITTGTGRRATIVIALVASLAIGFLAIRAAATWASAAAPLEMTPVAAQALQARLADETARAKALETRLTAITAHAQSVQDALTAAQVRLTADSAHAEDLTAQLATAKAKLAALERSIKAANSVRLTGLSTRATTSGGASGGEHEGVDDD